MTTSALPTKYRWLSAEHAPRMLVEALREFGTLETPGTRDNPKILAWAKECGLQYTYTKDSIPWCGLFMALVARRAQHRPVKSPLWALSWSTFGAAAAEPMLGDILTFTRKGGGHVGLYVGEDTTHYHVLGGNQSDKVTISRIEKKRMYQARRPMWKVKQPANVRKIILSAQGTPTSANEA